MPVKITAYSRKYRCGGRVNTKRKSILPVSYTHLTLPTTPYV